MEFVFVVRRQELFERECPQGFLSLPPAALERDYLRSIATHGFFVERKHAEQDASLKQIIPYCVVTDGTRALCLQRQSSQGEARLHRKLSIGIGGHLNPPDASHGAAETLASGALREICEELEVDAANPVPVGVLNDDSNPVGSVHFGVVHVVRLPADVRVRETDHMIGHWTDWPGLRSELARGANFETWSALILRSWAPEEFLRVAAHSDLVHSGGPASAESFARASSSR